MTQEKYLGKNQEAFTSCQLDVQEAWQKSFLFEMPLGRLHRLSSFLGGKAKLAKLQFGHWRMTETQTVIISKHALQQ